MKSILKCGAAATALFACATASQAATINLVDQGGVTGSQAEMGFNVAAAYWGSVLSNNVTINLGVSFAALGSGIIGSTGSASMDYTAANWKTGVQNTRSSFALDQTAVLPTLTNGAIAMITNGAANGQLGVQTNNVVWDSQTTGANSTNNKVLYLNTAVVKAVGGTAAYDPDNTGQLDGEVQFSSAFSFDFDPTNGVTAGQMDFIGVAIHEIGHALGFVSGVDYYDYFGRPSGPGRVDGNTFNFNQTSWFSALDMFRYSNDVTNVAPGTGPVLDLSVTNTARINAGGNPYFSIDGGATQLFGNSQFATGAYNGDGDQASHWKDAAGCSGQIGILDPTFCYGQMGEVTALDLAAYDAMGWNLNFDVLANSGYRRTSASIFSQFATPAVPEPATWAMMIAGFGFVGASMRSRRRETNTAIA